MNRHIYFSGWRQDYRDQGRISYIRLGGKILYKVSDIEKLLEDNYHEALI